MLRDRSKIILSVFLLPLICAAVFLSAASIFFPHASDATAAPPAKPRTDALVRVLILEEKRSVHVTVKGSYRIWGLPSGQLLKSGKGLQAQTVIPTATGLRVGKEEWLVRGIRIEPLETRDLFLNKSQFRGKVDILKDKNTFLYAINRLN